MPWPCCRRRAAKLSCMTRLTSHSILFSTYSPSRSVRALDQKVEPNLITFSPPWSSQKHNSSPILPVSCPPHLSIKSVLDAPGSFEDLILLLPFLSFLPPVRAWSTQKDLPTDLGPVCWRSLDVRHVSILTRLRCLHFHCISMG